jgi:hypothetical protein
MRCIAHCNKQLEMQLISSADVTYKHASILTTAVAACASVLINACCDYYEQMNRGIGVIDVQKAFAAQSGKLQLLYAILHTVAVAVSEFYPLTMLMLLC